MWRAAFTAFEIANGLVVDTQRFGEFGAGYFSLCTQHRDPVMDSLCHAGPHSPLLLNVEPTHGHR